VKHTVAKHVAKVCDTPWKCDIACGMTPISIAECSNIPFLRSVLPRDCPPGTWQYFLGDVVIVKNCLAITTRVDGTCIEVTSGSASTSYGWQLGGRMLGDVTTGWYALNDSGSHSPTTIELFSNPVKAQLLAGAHPAQRVHRATAAAFRVMQLCAGPKLEAVEDLLGMSQKHFYGTQPPHEAK
jgi:hypothetical protein